jgi:hypothetical protein
MYPSYIVPLAIYFPAKENAQNKKLVDTRFEVGK